MSAAPSALRDATPRERRMVVVRAGLRVFALIAGLLALYYLLPMDRERAFSPVALLAIALPVVTVVCVLELRAIVRSPLPAIRAVEALATAIPLLILSFATVYFLMSQASPETYSEPLTRTGALYFSMTVFSTVGFGDITPVTDTARLVVAGQMFIDLVVLGVGIRVTIGAVQVARERRATATPDVPPGQPSREGG